MLPVYRLKYLNQIDRISLDNDKSINLLLYKWYHMFTWIAQLFTVELLSKYYNRSKFTFSLHGLSCLYSSNAEYFMYMNIPHFYAENSLHRISNIKRSLIHIIELSLLCILFHSKSLFSMNTVLVPNVYVH